MLPDELRVGFYQRLVSRPHRPKRKALGFPRSWSRKTCRICILWFAENQAWKNLSDVDLQGFCRSIGESNPWPRQYEYRALTKYSYLHPSYSNNPKFITCSKQFADQVKMPWYKLLHWNPQRLRNRRSQYYNPDQPWSFRSVEPRSSSSYPEMQHQTAMPNARHSKSPSKDSVRHYGTTHHRARGEIAPVGRRSFQ